MLGDSHAGDEGHQRVALGSKAEHFFLLLDFGEAEEFLGSRDPCDPSLS